ncbi:MAG: hypothetical protein JXR88_10425 [Clostridia bacterium]|nr:hypothetical protein [Clostridia bacterium]
MKKKISILLIFLLLVNQFAIALTYDEDRSRDLTWTEFASSRQIDTNIVAEKNVKGLEFNRELYDEKGLIVYGDYQLVPSNDFKSSTLNASGEGYYVKNGVKGEYRYHGYTYNASKITNDDFPRDSDSGRKLEQKTWVSKPWDELSYANSQYQNVTGTNAFPQFTIILDKYIKANMFAEVGKLQKQIADGIPFNMSNATDVTYIFNESTPSTSRIATDYVAVEVAPGTLYSGQGVMFHKSPYGESAHGAWYQTLSIEKTNDKVEVPVTATIKDIKYSISEDGKTVEVYVVVGGEIEDDFVYEGTELEVDNQKQVYFNREDIDYWEMKITNSLTNDPQTVRGWITRFDKKTGEGNLNFTIPYESYEALLNENNEFTLKIDAEATAVLYAKDDFNNAICLVGTTFDTNTTEGGAMEEEPLPIIVDVEIDAPKEMLDIDDFAVIYAENNMGGVVDRYITVDGQILSEADELKFISGTYRFPKIRQNKVYNWSVVFKDFEGTEYRKSSFVIVYDSVPTANTDVVSYFKENRLNAITGDFSPTPHYVKDRIPSITVSVSIDKTEGIVYKSNTLSSKEFIVKQPDFVTITTVVSNNLSGGDYGERTYTNYLYIGEDLRPDIIANIWNPNLARGDNLDIICEATSLDGDNIQLFTYEIFYDEDQDGVAEKSVYRGEWGGETDFAPNQLGYYEIVWKTKESFGEPTIISEITDDDYRSFELKREFTVDNLLPMTKIYTDIEYNFPSIEVILVLDEELSQADSVAIKNNAVNITNMFRRNSMVADVDIFDTKTYIYEASASASTSYSTSYPSSTYHYSNNGYTNPSLPRVSVSTKTKYRDDSYVTEEIEEKIATSSTKNTVTIHYNQDGSHAYTEYSYGYPSVPSTKSYSDASGFKGTLTKTGARNSGTTYTYWSNGNRKIETQPWTAYYSGTVSRKIQVNHPVKTKYDVYSGNYSGVAYKSIKQNFIPDFDVTSNKYLIYITGSVLSSDSKDDFDAVKMIAKDAKIFGIAKDIAITKSLGDHVICMPYQTDILKAIEDVVMAIKQQNPVLNALTVLQNESFVMSFTDFDPENDPLNTIFAMQYVHNPYFFDNPTGQESGTFISYARDQFTSEVKTKFLNVGEYTIIRKIADEPLEDPTKGLDSNQSELTLYVHRKPIANFSLKWIYDKDLGKYLTEWVDESFDPDFQFSDPYKGIIDRKIKYRKEGGSWIYGVPSVLEPGDYELTYLVCDNFGVWSDPVTKKYKLLNIPPPQILNAKIRAEKESFNISLIPSTEWIELYNIVTQYPYETSLRVFWSKNGIPIGEVFKSENHTGDQNGLINWEPIKLQIPKSFSDGLYELNLNAENSDGKINAQKRFIINVSTPIDLIPEISDELLPGQNKLFAHTSEYVDEVSVTLFANTSYETKILMDKIDSNLWQYNFTLSPNISEASYQFDFDASVNSKPAKHEIINEVSKVVQFKIDEIEILGEWENWKRDQDIFGEELIYNPKRFLALEYVYINLKTTGNPDKILLEVPVEFENRTYVDKDGLSYDNLKFTGDQTYPILFTQIDEGQWSSGLIIPLVDSTLSYDNERLNRPYEFKIIAYFGENQLTYIIPDIEVTGNVYNHLFLTPRY